MILLPSCWAFPSFTSREQHPSRLAAARRAPGRAGMKLLVMIYLAFAGGDELPAPASCLFH